MEVRWLSIWGENGGYSAALTFAVRPFSAAYAAASVRLAVLVLLRMFLTWLPTVRKLMKSSSAISLSVLPKAISRMTSTSRVVNPAGDTGAWTGWEVARALRSAARSIKGRIPRSVAMDSVSFSRPKAVALSPIALRSSRAMA